MEQDRTRLHSLDGLRGLAVLLVFLNHITPIYIIAAFPLLDRIGLFSSGVTGVTFFFILSGFLMSYLYPNPQSKFGFLQKRYTRIFPLFLTMCACMLAFTFYPSLPLYAIGIIISLAFIVHVVWVYVIKKNPFPLFSKILFFIFLTLQFAIGGFYLFWIMRQPPIVLQHFGLVGKNVLVGLVNATLTFPLGNYIPMLDGVYWSLAAEILFYLLYPFIIIPIALFLIPQKRIFKILFLLSLFPFLQGVDILSRYIFGLSALQFSLFYYFAFGIMLGYLYRTRAEIFTALASIFNGKLTYLPVLFLILLLVGEHFLNATLPGSYASFIRLLSAFPFAAIVALALSKESSLYKFLSNKILVFLGTISYSMYLSHAAIIHIIQDFHRSGSLVEDIMTIVVTFTLTIMLSSLLYFLLEKPYFMRRKHTAVTKSANTHPQRMTFLSTKFILVSMLCIYIIAIFLSFQSKFNLFSLVTNYDSSVFLGTHPSGSPISLQKNPTTTLMIPATHNNLGIILASIKHVNSNLPNQTTPSLFFTVQNATSKKIIARLPYVLDEFRGEDFPFGIPVIPDSQGHTYLVTFALVPPSTTDYITIDPTSVKAIYQLDKNVVIKNPRIAFDLFISKLQNVFSNQLSLITLLLLVPLGILSIFFLVVPQGYF